MIVGATIRYPQSCSSLAAADIFPRFIDYDPPFIHPPAFWRFPYLRFVAYFPVRSSDPAHRSRLLSADPEPGFSTWGWQSYKLPVRRSQIVQK